MSFSLPSFRMNHYDAFARGLKIWLLIVASILSGMLIGLVRHTDQWIQELHRDTHRNLVVIGGAAADLEKTLRAERDAASAQLAEAGATAKSLAATSTAAQQLVAHTDASLNGTAERPGLLPTAARAISDQDAALVALEAQATATIADLDAAVRRADPILANLGQGTADLAHLAADPSLKESLAKLDQAITQTNDILANIDAITASGNRDAQMLETRLRQALKPASLVKTIFTRALGLAGPAAQVVTAAKP